jgi:pimeloyl-ACP methyl ester carboxylesterase
MATQKRQQYGAISIDITDEGEVMQPKGPSEHQSWPCVGVFLRCGVVVFVTTLFLIASSVFDGRKDPYVVPAASTDDAHKNNQALFYNEQLLDHFSNDHHLPVWSHRYYKSTEFFGGPGSPISLVVGGEGALDHGMLYPFVTNVLAKRFNAAVIQPEHRFYGPYKPIQNATTEELLQYLTPQQAMADMLRLVTVHLRETDFAGCSPHRTSPMYCPLITVGGSYPGFLSAMFRLVHPDIVDAAYASSAPLYMYAQRSDPNVFYDIVTAAAESTSPGCRHSVKATLLGVVEEIRTAQSLQDAAIRVGVCDDLIPKYITSKEMLSDALVQMTSFSFADYDMGSYPPGPDTGLYKMCKLFQDPELDTLGTMKAFFDSMLLQRVEEEAGCDMPTVECHKDEEMKAIRAKYGGRDCFDLTTQLPGGPDSTLEDTAGDNDDGKMWDFQTCTNVIFLAGFSESSMFPAKNATYHHLKNHCRERFGVTPRPHELADLWGFDDLVNSGASRILFTNGAQDMWSGGSIVEDLSDSLLALNFENGAHHSDLSHRGPSDKDTDDIKEGFIKIADILGGWLEEIREESHKF